MSFRKYGGLQFTSKHNAVASYYNTSNNLIVTENVGQPNSYINFLSDISGNINIYGDLDISGNIHVSGDVDISGNLRVQEDIDISGNLHVQGNIDCSGNVNITGDVDISGNLHVQQDIDCSGNVNIDGDVDINGNLHVQQDIDCSGNVNITGNVDISGNLHVQKNIDCSGNGNITGDLDISGNLHVQKNIDCSGNLTVSGISYFNTKSNSTPYEIVTNAPIQITSVGDTHDKLILTAGNSDNTAGTIQYIWDSDQSIYILYRQLQLNPYGGSVFINKVSTDYNTDSYALDVSGNGRFSNSINLYNGLDNSSISQFGSALNLKNNSPGGYIYINPDGATGITVFNNGYVGIGTGTVSIYALNVNGNVNATSYNSSSDYRIKENVTQLDSSFVVDKLNPVTYLNTKSDKQDIGLIAHELQEIYPELVNGEKDGEPFQSVNYIGLIPILIKEIQELKKEIKSVKIELNELKNK
jgi:cytoskeletal protein CcmA (bactofilin family)